MCLQSEKKFVHNLSTVSSFLLLKVVKLLYKVS
jgi:hypothetical protein